MLRAFVGPGARLQFSLRAPIVPLHDTTFLQMTRLLQFTNSKTRAKLGKGFILTILRNDTEHNPLNTIYPSETLTKKC